MTLYMMFLIYLLSFISISSTQYPSFYQAPSFSQPNFYETGIVEYPTMDFAPRYHRHGRYNNDITFPYIQNYDYTDLDECVCSCNECSRPKTCCQQMCLSCNHPNILFMPYPYPIIVTTTATPETDAPTTNSPPPTTATTPLATTTTPPPTTTTSTTTLTTSKVTTESAVTQVDDDWIINKDFHRNGIEFDDIMKTSQRRNGDKKYILTSLRRTIPDGRPKYGIVQIPDRLAERLMSQLRQMRDINAE